MFLKNNIQQKKREAVEGYLFISPALIHLLIFVVLPVIGAIYLSTQNWGLLSAEKTFVGLGNYIKAFEDETFWLSLRNTISYVIGAVPSSIILSLGLALIMKNKFFGVNLFRTFYFIPVITSMVVVALVWSWIFDPMQGVLNYFLEIFGIGPKAWLGDPDLAMPAIIMVSVWKGLGYNLVIFLAGLSGISETLYDAAKVDGANRWKSFWKITLPLLAPTTIFVTVMTIISSFQVFGQVYVMTGGGPADMTKVIVFYIYEVAFYFFEMGYASAMAIILFLIITILTAVQFWFYNKKIDY